ncbi:hypothetical protein A6R68_09806, partial [Neotoma lepida]
MILYPYSDGQYHGTDSYLDSFSLVEMEISLGLTPFGQTLCLLQIPDLCNACTQDAQMKTPPVNGDRIPGLASTYEPATENNNVDETTAEQLNALNAYLPQLLNTLTDLDHWENPTAIQSKDSTVIRRDQAQEYPSIITGLSEQARIQGQALVEGGVAGANVGASEGAIDNMDNKHLKGKAQ